MVSLHSYVGYFFQFGRGVVGVVLDSKEDFPLIDNFTLLYLRILDPSANSLSFVYGVYL